MSIIKHLKLILKHKWYVFINMSKCGHPIRGIFHDLSKFSPTEFIESVKYFQGTRSPIEAAKEDKGYSDAWLHHYHRNKHHSNFWLDCSFGKVVPLKMPYKYVVELICDSIAAGQIYLKNSWTSQSPLNYYKTRDYRSFFHNDTRKFIERIYKDIAAIGWDAVARRLKSNYYKY